jgi:hypothetical protein
VDEASTSFLGCKGVLVVAAWSAMLRWPVVLTVKVLDTSVNADVVVSTINETISEYNIDKEAVVALSSDNASYMIRAADALKCQHACCLAHSLNLVGASIIQEFKEIFDVLANLNAYLGAPAARSRLSALRAHGLSRSGFNVIRTRWTSAYEGIQYLLHHWSDLVGFLDSQPDTSVQRIFVQQYLAGPAQSTNRATCAMLVQALEPIMATIRACQAGSRTLSMMIDVQVRVCIEMIRDLSRDVFAFGPVLATSYPEVTDTEWAAIFSRLGRAAAKVSTSPKMVRLAKIRQMMIARRLLGGGPDEMPVELPDGFLDPSGENLRLWRTARHLWQLPEYKDMRAEDFWAAVRGHTPTVAHEALKHLSIPPTSVDVERVFAVMRDMEKPNRASMRDDFFALSLFARGNRQAIADYLRPTGQSRDDTPPLPDHSDTYGPSSEDETLGTSTEYPDNIVHDDAEDV